MLLFNLYHFRRFDGLQIELNVTRVLTGFGVPDIYTDTFNCALSVLEDPTEFLNTYINTYRNYLKSLVRLPNDTEIETVEESDSSINVQDDVDEDEARLLQKLEKVRCHWSSEKKILYSPSGNNEIQLKTGCAKIDIMQMKPVDRANESILEPLNSFHRGHQTNTALLISSPKVQHIIDQRRLDEKIIVHTTCLSSDGKSTETAIAIHETVTRLPASKIDDHKNTKNVRQPYPDNVKEYECLVSSPNNYIEACLVTSPGRSPEDYEDDSDATLTPGEEEIESKEMSKKPTIILKRRQTIANEAVVRDDNVNENLNEPKIDGSAAFTERNGNIVPPATDSTNRTSSRESVYIVFF